MKLADGIGCMYVIIGVAGVAAGATVFGLPGYCVGRHNGMENTRAKIAELRLSERNNLEYTRPQREKTFAMQVVPTFGLVDGTHEYEVLKTACTTGVYGSKASDFNVPAERVKATYELCGWTLPEKK